MLGLCRALLRDPDEAEDAVQQTFLSAHRSLLNGADPREPAAWLATIARNECWGRISARMRQPLPTGDAEAIAGNADPLAEAIRSADLAALWRAIRALPRAQRDALLLREFGGLRYDELATALAVTEPAVESLLVRARSRLRTQLEGAYASLAPAFRFLVGSGTPAVAAKAAALGLGAAAVTGGVAPQMLTRHHLQPPPARAEKRAPAKTPGRHTSPPAPPVVHTIEAAVVAPPVVAARAGVPRRRHEPEREREHGATTTAAPQEPEPGNDSTTSTATSTTVPAVAPQEPLTIESRDGGDSGPDGGGSSGTSGDSGSSDGGSGPDGGR